MFERYIETETFLRIPLLSDGLAINLKGVVKNGEGVIIRPDYDDVGYATIRIDWIAGLKHYRIIDLIAFTFKRPRLTNKYWKFLSVEQINKDPIDVHPANLVWRYPIALGAEENNGFAYIPMHSRYLINKAGLVYDSMNKRMMTPHFRKGYYVFALLPDIGTRVALGRHRALCLTFIKYPTDVDDHQVNHKNGVAGDDDLNNLEWMTCSENRIHAIRNGLTLVNKPVISRNLSTGQECIYNTLKECCANFRLKQPFASRALSTSTDAEPFVHNGFEIMYLNKEDREFGNRNRRAILVRDIVTGMVTEFPSIVKCSEALGISKHIVNWRINTPTSSLYPDNRQFKRKADISPWYIPINSEMEILEQSWAKQIHVRFLDDGSIKEYTTQRLAARELELSEAAVTKWINTSGQPVVMTRKHGFVQMKSIIDQNPWREVVDPLSEYQKSLGQRTVLVKNSVDCTISEFSSCVACAKALGLTPTCLNWRLKKGPLKKYNGLQFKYGDDPISFEE